MLYKTTAYLAHETNTRNKRDNTHESYNQARLKANDRQRAREQERARESEIARAH